MCLFLYASIDQEIQELPVSAKSDYLAVQLEKDDNNTEEVRKILHTNQLIYIATDEGCACKFYWEDPPDDDWPVELHKSAFESSQIQEMRMKALYHLLGDLAAQSKNHRVALLAVWEGKEAKAKQKYHSSIEDFFRTKECIKEQILYELEL